MKILAALLFMPVAAAAQVWLPMGDSPDGVMSLDITSIRPQGQYLKAWEMWTPASADNKLSGPPYTAYQSYKNLSYFDCKSGTFAAKQTHYYEGKDGTGKVVHTVAPDVAQLHWDDPIPGTFGDRLLNYVCSRRK